MDNRGVTFNSDLDRWGTRSISVRIARTDGGSVPRCSCILPHLANSQWRGKIDSREESSRERGFLSRGSPVRRSRTSSSRCRDRAARMERIGPLGALRSTDRWNQVSVDPIEGPLPEHVGAEQPGAVSWASAADRQRARSFSARASFGQGTSPGLARWSESLGGTDVRVTEENTGGGGAADSGWPGRLPAPARRMDRRTSSSRSGAARQSSQN